MATVYKMEVNKKENGEYKLIGAVDVPVFGLEEFGLDVAPTGKDEEGLPIYSSEAIDYVFSAILAATKADARNKLQSGTIALRAGCTIAATVAELIAKAERSGAALAINREFLKSFADFLTAKSGKSAAVQSLYNGMVKNRQSISLSSEPRRNGLLTQLTAYAGSLGSEEADKFSNILLTITDLCEGSVELEDSDL